MTGTKRILHKIKMTEISAVDRPAQIHAKSVIMKRAQDESTNVGKPADKTGIRKTGGHVMSKELTVEELQSANTTLEKKLAQVTALSALSDAEKAFYKNLDEAAGAAFLNKSAEDRAMDLEMAKSEDPVVYTSTDGSEFRKSDDPRVVASVKRADIMEKNFKAEIEKSKTLEFEKRAKSELSHLPGETEVHVSILKALDTIGDEGVRASALSAIRAGSTAMKKNFERRGTSGGGSEKTDVEQLDDMAKAYAKEHGVDFIKAYDMVLNTPEGSALYAGSLN